MTNVLRAFPGLFDREERSTVSALCLPCETYAALRKGMEWGKYIIETSAVIYPH